VTTALSSVTYCCCSRAGNLARDQRLTPVMDWNDIFCLVIRFSLSRTNERLFRPAWNKRVSLW